MSIVYGVDMEKSKWWETSTGVRRRDQQSPAEESEEDQAQKPRIFDFSEIATEDMSSVTRFPPPERRDVADRNDDCCVIINTFQQYVAARACRPPRSSEPVLRRGSVSVSNPHAAHYAASWSDAATWFASSAGTARACPNQAHKP